MKTSSALLLLVSFKASPSRLLDLGVNLCSLKQMIAMLTCMLAF